MGAAVVRAPNGGLLPTATAAVGWGRHISHRALALPQMCSELARLGKEKILFAARERLLGVRGRTALLSPTLQASR